MLLGFVNNLIFTSRIEAAVDNAGREITWAESLEDWVLSPYEKITALGVTMILVDLGLAQIDWPAWIRAVKSHPSTAALPLVCFGSHKDVETIKAARQAGADQVLARSQFFSKLPDLIR
jgi:DNA-binding response OmpR family regulator